MNAAIANGAESLSDNLHGEGSGDFRVQSDGCSELAGGLDRIHGDVLRVDGSLGRQRDGDLVGGDATEQLAGLGDLGGDFDDGTLDEFLGGNSLFAGGNGLGQTSALHGLDLGGSVLGPCEAQTLRNQVVASVAGLDGHDVARVTQVIDGLGENNLSFSHFSNLSKISDRKWRTAAEPSRGRS